MNFMTCGGGGNAGRRYGLSYLVVRLDVQLDLLAGKSTDSVMSLLAFIVSDPILPPCPSRIGSS